MRKFLIIGLLVATQAASAAESANPNRARVIPFPVDIAATIQGARANFGKRDTNGDGNVSRAEFLESAAAQDKKPEGAERPGASDSEIFQRLDSNRNGTLSKDEFSMEKLGAAVRDYNREQRFARLDKDGNGKLTPDEYPTPKARLERLDANGDGTVTKEEAQDARARAPATNRR